MKGRWLVIRRAIGNRIRKWFGLTTPEEMGEIVRDAVTEALRAQEVRQIGYAEEAAMYRRVPSAFWFSHRRYEGTALQYPDPTEAELRLAWDAALMEARRLYGQMAIDQLIVAMAGEREQLTTPDPENPVPFLMERYGVTPSRDRFN